MDTKKEMISLGDQFFHFVLFVCWFPQLASPYQQGIVCKGLFVIQERVEFGLSTFIVLENRPWRIGLSVSHVRVCAL
jgi:hypothetical protein